MKIGRRLRPAKAKGYFGTLPFGSDLTDDEQRLLPALKWLKGASTSKLSLASAALKGISTGEVNDQARATLARLRLDRPASLKEHFLRALVRFALSKVTD